NRAGGESYLYAFRTGPSGKNIKRPLYEILIEHTGFPTC
ncbi:hypothetical protein OHPBIL_OHPBIL_05615, partial [Dysosmobacter welbionis]